VAQHSVLPNNPFYSFIRCLAHLRAESQLLSAVGRAVSGDGSDLWLCVRQIRRVFVIRNSGPTSVGEPTPPAARWARLPMATALSGGGVWPCGRAETPTDRGAPVPKPFQLAELPTFLSLKDEATASLHIRIGGHEY
jgi:hypothetical protein